MKTVINACGSERTNRLDSGTVEFLTKRWNRWIAATPILGAVLLLGLLQTLPAQGQARRDGSVDEEINVRLVTLDVYVTDKKGRPVEGLTLEDFEIREEQQPVEVQDFRSVRSGASGVDAARSANNETPLTVVVYLDEALLLPTDWARVREGVATFIEQEVPEGTGFVFARHSENLEVILPRTESKELMVQELELATHSNGAIDNQRSAERSLEIIELEGLLLSGRNVRVVAGDLCDDSWAPATEAGRAFAAEAEDRLSRSTESLARFISSLSGIPGRKSMLYVSGGLQMQPGSEVFYALADRCPDRQSEVASLVQEYQQVSLLTGLAAHANANRVTLYPLDAGGIRSSASQLRSTFQTAASLKDSMVLLGRETGGRTILNTADPAEALADLASDFHRYYEITYRPDRRFRADSYLVDVRLKNPGNRKVRYRRTVAPKSTQELLAERLISALVLGAEDNPLQAELTLDEPSMVDRKLVRQPVRVTVPRSALLLLEGETAPPQGLRLFLVARDAKNRGSDVREHTVTPTEMGGATDELTYIVNIDLEPGVYEIAVGIRDERAKRASYLRESADLTSVDKAEENSP